VVTDGVRLDLEEIAGRDADLARSGLAEQALALAGMVDDVGSSTTSRAAAARELRETLDRLRELAPAVVEGDAVDELAGRRVARVAGG
jgi:hypothetical protein